MFEFLLFSAIVLVGSGIIAFAWRKARVRAIARQRMENIDLADDVVKPEPIPQSRPFLARHRLLPWLFGFVAAITIHFIFGWTLPFIIAVGLIVGLMSSQLERHLAAKRTAKIENQLADAIDLMVGALGAGASVADALDNAMRESREPLHSQLEDMIGRIRFGDDPQMVYRKLAENVPLETFLLFASALSVQWETGGHLAPTLAGVGRTVRDRIEISRRIRSNSAQSEVSTIAVMLLTYFIALIMWRTNPEQMKQFLATSGGQWTVAGAILLQAVGLIWMSYISRLRF